MRAALREPLVHFLALGALLFLFFEWKGGASGPTSTRIVITEGVVQNLVAGFTRTWQRPPTPAELKGLVDEHVKEEIATREAIAMGLDRDDTVIRRRLRQKLEFLIDSQGLAPPTDAELQQWLGAHPGVLQAEPRVALRQVFVSTQSRGPAARAEAERLLARLRAAGPGSSIDSLGDASMLPRELSLGPASEFSRTFGEKFAAAVEGLEPGQWGGPVESAYGLHLVLVMQRVTSPPPALADVRPLVVREFLAGRSRKQLDELYRGLLAKYTVTIETPMEPEKKQAAASTAGAARP
jgi:parvulin-like peptidyl-prolyl isomerase